VIAPAWLGWESARQKCRGLICLDTSIGGKSTNELRAHAKAEAELKQQIADLLAQAGVVDEAEKHEPELDLPAEIKRREDRLNAIVAAKARLEQRQREADTARSQ